MPGRPNPSASSRRPEGPRRPAREPRGGGRGPDKENFNFGESLYLLGQQDEQVPT